MNSGKKKSLKRSRTSEEREVCKTVTPLKIRIKRVVEKENEMSEHVNGNLLSSRTRRGNKILEDSPIPSTKANSETTKRKKKSGSDESDDEDLEEMFLQLKKSGIKTVNHSKVSPQSTSKNNIANTNTPKRDKSEPDTQTPHYRTPNNERFKNKLTENNGSLTGSTKKVSNFEKKVPELEKLPEDLILNYKRTPKKVTKLSLEETPKKQKIENVSVETPPLRRSTRRRSTVTYSEDILNEPKTPVQSISKTPSRRASSVKKKENIEPRTPTCKIEEKLPSTPLEKARLSLHVSTVPDCLPCREKEYNNILTFLENKLWDGIGGCMYISGVPGTGKTATVTQVIKYLQNRSKEGKVPEFKYIEMNGMRLTDPRQAYVQLWQNLFDKKERVTADRAQRLLDSWFSKSDRKNLKKSTVLLVDELDLICTKKQDVVYNLLDWPTRTHSRLVVLTIANTMDMPERLFKGRVTSRMGLTRLTFMPYTHKQLEEIVLARLKGLNAFVTDAVRLVTRKVAAVSGDARRALDICRRATELPAPDETVKISHIEQAIREMTNSNIVKVIKSCSEMEKLFLRSLSDVSLRSNVEEVDLREVIDQLFAICVLEGISRPSVTSILTVSHRLKCCRLIFANQSHGGILQRLTLNVTQDDIHYALRT